MIHLAFRLRRPRRLTTRLTTAHPNARLALWCNLQSDVVQIAAPTPREREQVTRAILAEHPEARRVGEDALAFRCPHRRMASVSRTVERHGAMLLPPIRCEGGWDSFRVYCFDERRVARFVRDLEEMGELEILVKRRLDVPLAEAGFLLAAADLLGDLTELQAETFLLAVEAGYYELPRRATVQDIARRTGRPRTTMEEHLRKAERRLLTGLAPVVALRAGALRAPR